MKIVQIFKQGTGQKKGYLFPAYTLCGKGIVTLMSQLLFNPIDCDLQHHSSHPLFFVPKRQIPRSPVR